MSRFADPFTSEVGMTLLRVVKEHPGIHFRELARTAHLSSVGQLRHHLDRLEHSGALVELEDGRYKRFFVAGDHNPHLRPALALFARRIPHRIGALLLARPMSRTEIRRSLACADSTLGFHLKRMVASGDLSRERGRNCCIYRLSDPELVRTVLLMQHGALEEPAVTTVTPPLPPVSSAPLARLEIAPIPGMPGAAPVRDLFGSEEFELVGPPLASHLEGRKPESPAPRRPDEGRP